MEYGFSRAQCQVWPDRRRNDKNLNYLSVQKGSGRGIAADFVKLDVISGVDLTGLSITVSGGQALNSLEISSVRPSAKSTETIHSDLDSVGCILRGNCGERDRVLTRRRCIGCVLVGPHLQRNGKARVITLTTSH